MYLEKGEEFRLREAYSTLLFNHSAFNAISLARSQLGAAHVFSFAVLQSCRGALLRCVAKSKPALTHSGRHLSEKWKEGFRNILIFVGM